MTHLALPCLAHAPGFRHLARSRRDRGVVLRRALLDALRRAGGGMDAPSLAAGLGVGVPALRRHLPRLVAAGAVAWDRGTVRLVRLPHDAGARS